MKSLTSDKKIFSDDYNHNELSRNAIILDRFFGDLAGIKPEEMHSIRNLALVDKETNSAMPYYLLDRKRSILMTVMTAVTFPIRPRPWYLCATGNT